MEDHFKISNVCFPKIISWVFRYVQYFQTRRERSQVDAIVRTSVHMENFQILTMLETIQPQPGSSPCMKNGAHKPAWWSNLALHRPGEGVLCWAGGRIQLSLRSSDVFPRRGPTPREEALLSDVCCCETLTLGRRFTLFGDIGHCLGSLRTWKHPAVTSPDPPVALHGVIADLP